MRLYNEGLIIIQLVFSQAGVPTGGVRGGDWQAQAEHVEHDHGRAPLPDTGGRAAAGDALLPGHVRGERQGPQRSVPPRGHYARRLGEAHG